MGFIDKIQDNIQVNERRVIQFCTISLDAKSSLIISGEIPLNLKNSTENTLNSRKDSDY